MFDGRKREPLGFLEISMHKKPAAHCDQGKYQEKMPRLQFFQQEDRAGGNGNIKEPVGSNWKAHGQPPDM